ncbi:hypothetical protein ABZP36_019452 [Zizania latifolia]
MRMASPAVVALAVVVAALAAFCRTDPLRLGSMVEFPGFVAHLVELPDAAEMPPHADTRERLRGAEIRFRGEVQGPESVAFDRLGRGPYTGVADGRVLFWDGARWAYFAHSSPNWTAELCGPKASPFAHFMQLVFSGDPSGRLLKYDAKTKETTVLHRNIQFPNGVSLSKDGAFFVFCEGSRGRLSRYWLKGEKAGTVDLFAILPGFPDNVRTNDKGEFWVAIHCRRGIYARLVSRNVGLRKFLLGLPIPAKYHYLMQIGGKLHALIIKYSPDGEVLDILEDTAGQVVKAVSEVEEKDGKLWIGSVLMPFIAVFDYAKASLAPFLPGCMGENAESMDTFARDYPGDIS